MTEYNKENSDEKPNILHLPIWRIVVVGSVLVVGFYLFWLIPALNDIKEKNLAHKLEIAARAEIKLREIALNRPKTRLDELYVFLLPKLRNNITFDTLDQNSLASFLDGRDDVDEFSIIDMAGNEKIRIAQGAVLGVSELKNRTREKYLEERVVGGFSLETAEEADKKTRIVTVMKRFNVAGLGNFIFRVKVDISRHLKDFSSNLKKKENELVFLVDGKGEIIDHFDDAQIGDSALGYDFIRQVLVASGSDD